MSLSMYEASVPAFVQKLNNLSAILDKAEARAQDRKIEPEVLLNYRLAPDMLPLVRQIQIAADLAKGAAARLAGVEVPKHEDTEKTFADLKARITDTPPSLAPALRRPSAKTALKPTFATETARWRGIYSGFGLLDLLLAWFGARHPRVATWRISVQYDLRVLKALLLDEGKKSASVLGGKPYTAM